MHLLAPNKRVSCVSRRWPLSLVIRLHLQQWHSLAVLFALLETASVKMHQVTSQLLRGRCRMAPAPPSPPLMMDRLSKSYPPLRKSSPQSWPDAFSTSLRLFHDLLRATFTFPGCFTDGLASSAPDPRAQEHECQMMTACWTLDLGAAKMLLACNGCTALLRSRGPAASRRSVSGGFAGRRSRILCASRMHQCCRRTWSLWWAGELIGELSCSHSSMDGIPVSLSIQRVWMI